MSDFIDSFRDLSNCTIIIQRNGDILSIGPDGTPVYGPPIDIYNGDAIMWQLTSTERYEMSKINNPSTHRIVLFPDLITQDIQASDTVIVDGEDYRLYPGEDVLDQGVHVYTVAMRDST